MTLRGSGYLGAQNRCISPIPVYKSGGPQPPQKSDLYADLCTGGGGGGGVGNS